MLPDNVASTTSIVGEYTYPDTLIGNDTTDYEMGGVALNDGSQGLQVQPWVCWLAGSDIRVKPLNDSGVGTVLLSGSGITRLSIAFDNNMQPTVAYVQDDVVKLRWYDTTISNFVIDTFAGARTPRVCHDDNRPTATTRGDVIFAYLREDMLCYRQQRDRYLTERTLATGVPLSYGLKRMGMSSRLRLQFEMQKD